ncbi:hypothetical protein CWE11_10520 [Aliidiomarina sanyensis]|uniref:Solute-binding protein family 3/N-terminal domain-containing protein n=2 Tax=Aliidiomarina sanyensis TaxID=1249555 RepID=A0A432WBM8_9GAMM|nr:hypothetical protein CWE11_10520 [Aliidiomarina sanyensis]
MLVLALLLGGITPTSAQNEWLGTIVIGTISDIDDSHPTFLRVQQAYRMIGYDAKLLLLPYERSEYEANRGRFVDAELARTDEVQALLPNMIRIDVPLETDQISVFTARDDLNIQDWDDLEGLRIDTVRGMSVITRRLVQHHPFNEIGTVEQVFQRLESGRSDVAILPGNMAEFVLSRTDVTGIQRLHPGLEELPLYHYIHRHHQHLTEQLTHALYEVVNGEPHSLSARPKTTP